MNPRPRHWERASFDIRDMDDQQAVQMENGEILSAGMCRYIWRIRRRLYAEEEIAICFRQFWNFEIAVDTVRDVLRMRYRHTNTPLPYGYESIPEALITIPSGVYWHIAQWYDVRATQTQHDLATRFGYRMTVTEIEAVVDQWEDTLPCDSDGYPEYPRFDDIHPDQPGYHLGSLPTTPTTERIEFGIPPPRYSPRFRHGNLTLHHPNEVLPINGHLHPFFDIDQVPSPPPFEVGEVAPEYQGPDEFAASILELASTVSLPPSRSVFPGEVSPTDSKGSAVQDPQSSPPLLSTEPRNPMQLPLFEDPISREATPVHEDDFNIGVILRPGAMPHSDPIPIKLGGGTLTGPVSIGYQLSDRAYPSNTAGPSHTAGPDAATGEAETDVIDWDDSPSNGAAPPNSPDLSNTAESDDVAGEAEHDLIE